MTPSEFWDNGGFIYKKDKIQCPDRHKWNIPIAKLYEEWIVLAEDDYVKRVDFEEIIADIISDGTADKSHKYQSVDSVEGIIDQTCELYDITFDTRGDKIYQNKSGISFSEFETLVCYHNDRYTEDTPKDTRRVFATETIKRAIKIYTIRMDQKQRGILKDQMSVYNRQDALYVNEFLEWVVKSFKIDGDVMFNVAMIKHWMWQTKRYCIGMNVMSPIFCNFFGESQETGKTKFIQNLTKPFADYRIGISLSDMLDDRRSEAWTKNYVAVADELKLGDIGGKQLGQVIAVIKNYLTAESIEYRELGTHKFVKATRTFSPISSSNKSIVDVIFDDTGMRRFYEFKIHAKSDRIKAKSRVQEFIDCDIDALWRGINPNLEEGYVTRSNKYGDILASVQSQYKHFDYLDIFLDDEDTYFYNTLRSNDSDFESFMSKFESGGIGGIDPKKYQVHNVMVLVKEAKTWIKDIDPNSEKFVPSAMQMPIKLRKKGIHVIEDHHKSFVVVRVV